MDALLSFIAAAIDVAVVVVVVVFVIDSVADVMFDSDAKVMFKSVAENLKRMKDRYDACSPHFDAPMQPLSNYQLKEALQRASDSIGLQEYVNSAVLRRTFSLKSQLRNLLKAHQITEKMQHYRGDKNLHRQVYMPTHVPVDESTHVLGNSGSELMQDAIAEVGSIETVARASSFTEKQMQSLRLAVHNFTYMLEKDKKKKEETKATAVEEQEAQEELVAVNVMNTCMRMLCS